MILRQYEDLGRNQQTFILFLLVSPPDYRGIYILILNLSKSYQLNIRYPCYVSLFNNLIIALCNTCHTLYNFLSHLVIPVTLCNTYPVIFCDKFLSHFVITVTLCDNLLLHFVIATEWIRTRNPGRGT